MKVSILNKINPDILVKEIKFSLVTNYSVNEAKCKYLIMNSQTIKDLESDDRLGITCKLDSKYYRTFMGIPISECNKLDYGDVEIITE